MYSMKNIIDNHWVPSTIDIENPRYSCFDHCVYASILGSFNDCKIVEFIPSSSTEEAFFGAHNNTKEVTSSNMCSGVIHGAYEYMSTDNTKEDL